MSQPVPSRGLPPNVYVPIIAVLALAFLGGIAYFLKIAYRETGSAISPTVAASPLAQQGDANIQAGGGALPSLPPGEQSVPQSGGANAGGSVDQSGGAPAQAAGGPPAPVLALLESYRSRIAKDPGDLAAFVGLAGLYFDAGKFAQALPYYERALALDPKNPDVRTDYATSLHEVHRDLDAIAQLDTVLRDRPNFAPALFNKGIVDNAIGRRSDAIADFRSFLRVAPGDAHAGDARAALKNLGTS